MMLMTDLLVTMMPMILLFASILMNDKIHGHGVSAFVSSSQLLASSPLIATTSILAGSSGTYDGDHGQRITPSSSSSTSTSTTKYSFDAMTKFEHRLSMLEEVAAPDFLADYYEPDLRSFSIIPEFLSSSEESSSGTTMNSKTDNTTNEEGEEIALNTKKKTLSVSSTVYGLRAIMEYPASTLTRGIIGESSLSSASSSSLSSSLKLREQLQALIHSDWRENDLYEVSLLLSIILKLDPTLSAVQSILFQEEKERNNDTNNNHSSSKKDTTKYRFRTMLQKILSGRPRRRYGEEQKFSAYINYLCTTCYVDLANTISINKAPQSNNDNSNFRLGVIDVQNELFNDDDDDDDDPKSSTQRFFKEITVAVTRSAEIARDELCRQLAYKYSNDKGNFDVIKLVYNLLSYVKATESLKETATIISSASSYDAVQSTDTSEAVTESIPRINRRLVLSALQVFFDEQDHNVADGLWDRGQPIYQSFNKKGRNVGNAYVFGIDALGSVLDVLLPPEIMEGGGENFRPYLPNLERAFAWIERNIDVETTIVIADKQCDPDTGRCYGRALRGWCSPHIRPSTGPNAWSTAQTITCLARMRRIVKQLLHNDVLSEFGGISISSASASSSSSPGWDRLLDSDLGCNTNDDSSTGIRTIKSVLEERVITPFITAADVSNPGVGAAYSTILFGSPGTAKTTITEAVAEKLGWDFVVIDTSMFLKDGLSNVASRIRYVFERLQSLRRCVILFDEIEEFCLDRDNPNLSMESRMLTTAMLTAINDLRRTKQSIFFLATNRLRAFDAAIIRPGRFDMQLFVGTPNLESRVILLEQALSSSSSLVTSSSSIGNENKEMVIQIYRKFLQSEWTKDAMFMNYLESKQYASRIASIIESNNTTLDRIRSQGDNDSSSKIGTAGSDIESLLSNQELARILSQQAAVMTARGSVRDEYIAQMELSRL